MGTQEPTVEPEHVLDPEAVLDSPEAGGKIIRGGSLRMAGFAASVVIGTLTAPLIIRHLSIGEYGLYATATAVIFVVTGVTEGGIGLVAVREYAQQDTRSRQATLDNLLGLRFVLTFVGLLAAVGFTIVVGYPMVVTIGVIVGCLALFIGALQNTMSVRLSSSLLLGRLTVIDLVRQVTATVTIIILVVVGASLLPFYLVFPAGLVGMLIATLILAPSPKRVVPSFDKEKWAHLLKQTGVFAVATAFAIVYYQVALISVAALTNDVQAGYYGAAFRVVDVINGIPWLLATTAFPLVARSATTDPERFTYALRRMSESAALVGNGFLIAVVIGAPVILAFVGGAKLDPSLPVLRVIGFGIPFTFLMATFSYALLALKQHRTLLTSNAATFVLALALALLLIPRLGSIGAAVVTLCAEVCLASLYFAGLRRATPRGSVIPLTIWKSCLAVLVALGAGLALLQVSIFVAPLTAGLLYVALCIVMRAVPRELVDALPIRRGAEPS